MRIFQSLIGLIAFIILGFGISCNEDSFSIEDQFNSEQTIIMQFLDDNDIETQTDDNLGLNYRIIKEGNDTVPTLDDRMNITYTVSELGKSTIVLTDSSKTLLFSNILPGMVILMPLIGENGTIEMYLPSGYAFARQGRSNLAPNTPVLVTVHLNKIITNDTEQFKYDQYLIEQHIEANNLDAKTDSATGLKYVIEKEGDGFAPTKNSAVIVNYEGRIMDGSVFDSGEGTRFDLRRLISGWQILMPKVKEGGTIIMFLPSQYGYGRSALDSPIPPYAILRFEVDLIELPL